MTEITLEQARASLARDARTPLDYVSSLFGEHKNVGITLDSAKEIQSDSFVYDLIGKLGNQRLKHLVIHSKADPIFSYWFSLYSNAQNTSGISKATSALQRHFSKRPSLMDILIRCKANGIGISHIVKTEDYVTQQIPDSNSLIYADSGCLNKQRGIPSLVNNVFSFLLVPQDNQDKVYQTLSEVKQDLSERTAVPLDAEFGRFLNKKTGFNFSDYFHGLIGC